MKSKKKAVGKIKTDKRLVDNPYFQRGHPEGTTNPEKVQAVVNVRESAVETLYSRGFLGKAQKKAADRVRELWEAAGGKTGSLDYTLDRVDGGKGEPVIGRIQAAQELDRCRRLIGARGYDVLLSVCGEGKALTDITPHKRARLTMADNLRADLDDIAGMWGLMTKRKVA